ncbi:MAG TPA: PIN domain-containing protein [Nakamurella sp.]|nr:PIN domain-containing protein [Nakamurella sp.]
MIVVDASVVVAVLVGEPGGAGRAREALSRDLDWAAPSHQPAEVVNALRRLTRGPLTREDGNAAFALFQSMVILSLPLEGQVLQRIWELRDNATPYDAAYLAWAEVLAVPVLTADAKLVGIPSARCEVRVLG